MSADRRPLQNKYLDGLSEAERRHVFLLTRELSEALDAWVRCHAPLIRPVRVPQVALTMAAAAPFLGVRELLPAARMSLWLFAVDDLCDGSPVDTGGLPDAPPWSLFERSLSLLEAAEDVDPGDEPLPRAMRDIREELAGFPLAAALRPHLVASLREVRTGMWLEAEWSSLFRRSPEGPGPSLEEYLERAARHTIGTLSIYLCVLSTLREVALIARLPALVELGREAALGLRLANDLQGHAREVLEGKLDALAILQRDLVRREGVAPQVALARARAEVKARAVGVVARCLTRGGERASAGAWPERVMLNALAFAFDFYTHHDYHHPVAREEERGLEPGPSPGA